MRKPSFASLSLGVLTMGALCATTTSRASAASTGFALDRFEPSERGSEWFAQDTLDLRGHVRAAAGLVGDFGYKPLVIYNTDGSERTALVQEQLFVHVGAALNLWDRVRFAFNLPVAVHESGHDGTVNGTTFSGPSGAGIGDLRVGADVRLFGQYREPITLALGLQAWLPTGSQSKYLGDGKVRLSPRLQAAGELGGVFVYSARVGIDYRALQDTFDGSPLGTTFSFGASAGVRVLDGKLVVGPELWGSTVVQNGAAFTKQATPFEAIVGGHYTAGDFRVGLGVGPGLSRGFGTPKVRGLLSLEWAPGATAAAPPSDRDHDGIYDEDDACPDVKGVKTDDPKTNGCPPEKDSDGDGIVDSKDACPTVKGIKSDDPKKNGCPADRDGDGIPDDVDACPDVKGVASARPEFNGCPPDKDGDGIKNEDDACPDAPGPKNADPKKNGCPAAAIVGGEIKILQQVKFKTASDVILPESDKILTEVSKILRDHPEITKIRVEGHTDNQGAAGYNKDLSKKRAASVVKWMTTKGGIDALRLESEGFGQEKPIAPNDNEKGRQENRRVEFHIVVTGKPGAVKDN